MEKKCLAVLMPLIHVVLFLGRCGEYGSNDLDVDVSTESLVSVLPRKARRI